MGQVRPNPFGEVSATDPLPENAANSVEGVGSETRQQHLQHAHRKRASHAAAFNYQRGLDKRHPGGRRRNIPCSSREASVGRRSVR